MDSELKAFVHVFGGFFAIVIFYYICSALYLCIPEMYKAVIKFIKHIFNYKNHNEFIRFIDLHNKWADYYSSPKTKKDRWHKEGMKNQAKLNASVGKMAEENKGNGLTYCALKECVYGPYGCHGAPCPCDSKYQEYLRLRDKFCYDFTDQRSKKLQMGFKIKEIK